MMDGVVFLSEWPARARGREGRGALRFRKGRSAGCLRCLAAIGPKGDDFYIATRRTVFLYIVSVHKRYQRIRIARRVSSFEQRLRAIRRWGVGTRGTHVGNALLLPRRRFRWCVFQQPARGGGNDASQRTARRGELASRPPLSLYLVRNVLNIVLDQAITLCREMIQS